MPDHLPEHLVQATRFAPLTEADIKAQTDSGSYSRGRSYYHNGHILEPALREDAIEAQCIGSDYAPYRVRATLASHGEPGLHPRSVSCTCPRGGFCKHIVALLLTWVHHPDQFVVRASLAEQLHDKSREDLVVLVSRMVERYPDLERLVELPTPPAPDTADAAPNATTVDEKVIRRQVRDAMRGLSAAEYGWDSWGYGTVSIPPELRSMVELGQQYVAANQLANAMVIFSTIAEEVIEQPDDEMFSYDEEGELAAIVATAEEGLAACLNAQAELPETERLSSSEREHLIEVIYGIWAYDVFEAGGIGLSGAGPEAIAGSATADERERVKGWLRQAPPDRDWAKSMATEFLVMLAEAEGASDEQILELYRDAGLWDSVAHMQLGMGDADAAIRTARQYLTLPNHLITFANSLIAQGGEHVRQALSLIEDRAWETEGHNPTYDASYQNWLTAQYGSHGRPQDALAMAQRSFERQPSVRTYQTVRETALLPQQPPNTWMELRPKLIAHFEQQQAWPALVEIHLMDGEVGAALGAYDQRGEQPRTMLGIPVMMGYGSQTERLAQAAEHDFPDRAIGMYIQMAEGLIANKQRSAYQGAAGHLVQVKAILERLDRAAEWRKLITDLRETHKRLPALQDELNKLDLR